MRTLFVAAVAFALAACSAPSSTPDQAPQTREEASAVPQPKKDSAPLPAPANAAAEDASATEVATFAAGCYWCVEAVYQRIDGVVKVRSGFTGGHVENPTYEQCCTGETGHAESVEITFDPKKVSYETLLDWFWRLHDPTSLNRQGADEGTQYRSAIFWHSEAQRAAAEKSKQDAQGAFAQPIVTEIAKAGPFYPAAAYHQDYYNRNREQGYCRVVIAPKLHKLGLEEK
jgi:peptide-methionine (S)-S-oxide reductase